VNDHVISCWVGWLSSNCHEKTKVLEDTVARRGYWAVEDSAVTLQVTTLPCDRQLDGWIDRERYDLLVRRSGGEGDSCATPTDRHKITADSPTCAYVQGGPQKLYIHHIVGTVQYNMKRISPKCSQSCWKQRLRCNFNVVVKYSLQISSVLWYREMTAVDGCNRSYFLL